jgi:hypothetical protein
MLGKRGNPKRDVPEFPPLVQSKEHSHKEALVGRGVLVPVGKGYMSLKSNQD